MAVYWLITQLKAKMNKLNYEFAKMDVDNPSFRILDEGYDDVKITIIGINDDKPHPTVTYKITRHPYLYFSDDDRANIDILVERLIVQLNSEFCDKKVDTPINPQSTVTESFKIIQQAMQEDTSYAWSWHCNIAVPMMDEGVKHKRANRSAANIMRNIFNVDVTKFPEYITIMERTKE